MATRLILNPFSAEFPASNFPQLLMVNRRPVLAFDAATDETAYWTAVAPQGVTGTWTAVLSLMLASATSGAVGFQVQVEAVTTADATDLDAATSFDTVNNSASTTVPATAGYLFQISITLSNMDSVAAADYLRFSVNRDADGSAITDSAAGDVYLLGVEIRDGA